MPKKYIHISLSPNLETDDVFLSFKWLFSPWRWSDKKTQEQLKRKLLNYFPNAKAVFLFNSGRSALMLGLKALNLPANSKVLLQSFTCAAVPNALLWNKLLPEYLDIKKEDYNLDPNKLPNDTTVKALISQHTFGQPANLDKIIDYCQQKKIYLIEDCAHSLGAKYKGNVTGSFGDIAFLSFGRDKVISSVFGGALIVNNEKLVKQIENLYQDLSYPNFFWTIQQLLHPLITLLAKKTYSIILGKFILAFAQKTKIISKAIYPQERHHQIPSIFPSLLPEPLAVLANNQFLKLSRFNNARQKTASYYEENLNHPKITKPLWNPEGIFLRYTITLDQPEKLKSYLKEHNIIIEKKHWYTQPITPLDDLTLVNYQYGKCPVTEEICQKCLNLPTNPTMNINDVKYIVNLINQWQL